ncbi:MAG TPA: GNAT family N-acetyltransferase [Pyrinomonadaceae bacterium]|jgi:RimJ/RimL family protein N-acetyltransferase|nr:GNAT family N-acetyltransferase [Pyrinomonadaceae bacterium]
MSITFRPVGPDDEPFLLEVYASTRSDEMALVPWTDAQREAFVKMQFTAQRQHYLNYYSDADYLVILSDDRAVGRLYVARLEGRILIIDITFLPAERNMGRGTSIIKSLMDEAAAAAKPLQIHVEFYNPSLRLFERLGFRKVDESGPYLLMEWNPAA